MLRKTTERLKKYSDEQKRKRENYKFLNENFCKKGQVVFFGDSITEILNIEELFTSFRDKTGLHLYNRGISGDNSLMLLDRAEDNLLNINPCIVVILIGTNDFGMGADVDFVFNNIKDLVSLIRKKSPETELIIQSVYPVNRKIRLSSAGKRSNRDIRKLNEKLFRLSLDESIPYINLYEDLSDEHKRFDEKYTYDGLHPNVLGFSVAASKIEGVLFQIYNKINK